MKDTWTDGYKVLKSNRHSYKAGNSNELCSLIYPLNEEVKPKIKGSKLFAFINRKDAIQMINDSISPADRFKLVKCKMKNVIPCRFICGPFNNATMKAFWKGNTDWNVRAPHGTVLADAIICLE